jgi:hypothetical protein
MVSVVRMSDIIDAIIFDVKASNQPEAARQAPDDGSIILSSVVVRC